MREAVLTGALLLVLLPLSPGPGRRSGAPPQLAACDRKLSAIARRLIHAAWLPVVTQYPGLRLPLTCPFHPWRDVQGQAELAKMHYRVNLWTCSACGKSFHAEGELENHIAARHPHLAVGGDFSVCLADYCDVLRCSGQRAVSRRPWPVRPAPNSQSLQVAMAPSRELVALLEEEGGQLATVESNRVVSSTTLGRGCRAARGNCAHCAKGQPSSSSRLTSRPSSSQNGSEDCPECSVAPAKCDRNKMAAIRKKCESLVDICTNTLSLQLSDGEWTELRSQLGRRVCWYLTCERYWDRQQQQQADRRGLSHTVGILLVLVAAALIYLTFSYYVIWIVF